jgi:tRNA-2-methylthio-N6-dimethylallyladenosine synthase
VAHLARYSTRPGTVAARRMKDDVSETEKMRRFRLLEDLQEQVVTGINAGYLGQSVEVLFEEKVKKRWKGRTPTNKLVFVDGDGALDLQGQVRPVKINWTGPWSMMGNCGKNIARFSHFCSPGGRRLGGTPAAVLYTRLGWRVIE